MFKCVVLSGLSGSGKTTIGTLFCQRNKGWEFVDGDWFFLADKPKVLLSNGDMVSNWDDQRAVDWDALNKFVIEKLHHTNVMLVTFLPLISKFTFPVALHVTLSMGANELRLCIEARRVSKKKTDPVAILRDELMVKEYVYPAFKSLPPSDKLLLVIGAGGVRRTKEDITTDLEALIL